MSEKEIIRVLELAEEGKLPDRINNDTSTVSVETIRELHEGGFLEAIDASSQDDMEYLEPRINIYGREYLKELKAQHNKGTSHIWLKKVGLGLLGWLFTIIAGLIVAWFSWKYFK
ncbi:hypothetical protein [Nitrospina watsonii]|uniref:Uncharacterized protein n=1 Tax=Nitrospina watsonii TaxID=1323948 RepID=A0ABM9HDX0_9BACT|nr:hypothetical protein [Nitrospina watsonii]CAI2718432.1 conserved protein of unknown function [Nitrospina watsonii]